MIKKKIKVGIIFGGRSFEHEVSLISAKFIIDNLDKKKYKIFLFGINKNSEWLVGDKAKKLLLEKSQGRGALFPKTSLIKKIDLFFPILHGPFGEDGKLQGMLEILNKPYVGANVLASAIGMDKIIQKLLFKSINLPIVDFIWFSKFEWQQNKNKILRHISKEIGFPCFVKPSNSGSSVGISKIKEKNKLAKAIKMALKYDLRILIEKAVSNTREIEISILGNNKPVVSCPGEIIPSNEFYDYKAKYIDGKSKAVIPATLDKNLIKKIKKLAIKAYKIIDCQGMARIDFLLNNKNKKIYINEVNTIPGFTSISMYPKLWQVSGLTAKKLLDNLIKLAFTRWKKQNKISYNYKIDK